MASASSPSRGSTATSRASKPDGPRWQSSHSSWCSSGCGTSARSSATATRSCSSASRRCSFRCCPVVGREINGARLWVRVGPLNFQPGEAAKVLLVIFFAAYLVDKRELLQSGTRRFPRDGAPRSEAPRTAAARVELLDPRDGPPEGPRVVAPVLRGVRRDALHRHRARFLSHRRVRDVRRGRGGRVPVLLSTSRIASARGSIRGRSRAPPGSRSCSRCTRSGAGASRAPDSGSEARRRSRTRPPTSCSPRSARSWASSGRSRCASCSCCSSAAGFASRSRPIVRSPSCSPQVSPRSWASRRS